MEELKGKIYVRFIEMIACSIPVPARGMGNDLYKIQPYYEFDYADDSMLFEFGPGDVVIASTFIETEGNEIPCANQLVSCGDDRNMYKNLLFNIVKEAKNNTEQNNLIETISKDTSRKLLGELHKDTFVYPDVKDWIEFHRDRLESLIKE